MPVRIRLSVNEVKRHGYNPTTRSLFVSQNLSHLKDDVLIGGVGVDCNFEDSELLQPGEIAYLSPTVPGELNYSVSLTVEEATWHNIEVHAHPDVRTPSVAASNIQSSFNQAGVTLSVDSDSCKSPSPIDVCDDVRAFANFYVYASTDTWPVAWEGSEYKDIVYGEPGYGDELDDIMNSGIAKAIVVKSIYNRGSSSYPLGVARGGKAMILKSGEDQVADTVVHEWGHVLSVNHPGGMDNGWHRPISPESCHKNGIMWHDDAGNASEVNHYERIKFQ